MNRDRLEKKLHHAYEPQHFDNTDVWTGNLRVLHHDDSFAGPLVRFFHPGPGNKIRIRVGVELYARGITEQGIDTGDVDVRLWTDVDDHGYVDPKGEYRPAFGGFVPMRLVTDSSGKAIARGNNVVFLSDELTITKCGVFSHTAQFSADGRASHDPAKTWVSANDIAFNRDGIIVVSPRLAASCPSIMEICPRKWGASIGPDGRFVSGSFRSIAADLGDVPAEVIYLLPFFLPGTKDLLTGEDVRKGALGSIYAIRDFFRIDPDLCPSLADVDIHEYLEHELISDFDIADLLSEGRQEAVRRASDLARFKTGTDLADFAGRDTADQIAGRAELRRLVRAAHDLGKKVIFDMVIMQTSRDNDLIREHLDWYQVDGNGHPSRHRIAWLDYSDVALFRLAFNKPLQSYLTSVAAYWIKTCNLDGIRIDAAQTVDRPFLKQISNRLHDVKPDALVLGETLCAVPEAVDVSTDMIYSLLVDHHVNIENARPFIDLFEYYHRTFARHTTATAYFENHDSPRATRIWQDKYRRLFETDAGFRRHWSGPVARRSVGEGGATGRRSVGEGGADVEAATLLAALMKNLQASVINATAGSGAGVRFAYCVEMGSDYGERVRTDFENPSVPAPAEAAREPNRRLRHSYFDLEEVRKNEPLLAEGRVYYFTTNLVSTADRVLCYARHDESRVVVLAFNLHPAERQDAAFEIESVPVRMFGPTGLSLVFDSYRRFTGDDGRGADETATRASLTWMDIPQPPGETGRVGRVIKLSLPPLAAVVIDIID